MSKQRIQLTDSTMDVVVKMSEGNPGAMNVLMMILSTKNIDPNNMEGLAPILLLDALGIYGTDIYVLHNDLCNRNLSKTLAVLRAVQLGLFSESILVDACHRQDYSGRELVPVDELCVKVKERLPEFNFIEV